MSPKTLKERIKFHVNFWVMCGIPLLVFAGTAQLLGKEKVFLLALFAVVGYMLAGIAAEIDGWLQEKREQRRPKRPHVP